MKSVMFGMDACPDCTEAKKELDAVQADYLYQEIGESTTNMKRFLKLRDKETLFDQVKADGKIGVPCFKLSDGTLTLNLQEVLQKLH